MSLRTVSDTPIRYRVDPRDVSEVKAARYMGLTLSEFQKFLPALQDRGFPKPDETTGNYDLDAINEWRKRRFPNLYLTNEHRFDSHSRFKRGLEELREACQK